MKFLPQKARTKNNSNADLISDLSDELESIYSTSLTDVNAVRRSYTNNSSGSIKGSRRKSVELHNNSTPSKEGSTRRRSVIELNNNSTPSKSSNKEVPSNNISNNPNVNVHIETQSTGGSSVSSRIKQFETSKISKIMNKRGFSTKKGGKSPIGKGGGNSSFNDDWRSGTLPCVCTDGMGV